MIVYNSVPEKYDKEPNEKTKVNFVNIGQTHKPVVDFAGMLVIGADVDEFPELSELPEDSDK